MSEPKKYRKKPATVEAVQWTRNDAPRKLIDFTNGLVQINDVEDEFKVYDRLHDVWVPFYWGDWIIRGIKGEFYPCRDDIFKETYEAAAEVARLRQALEQFLGELNDDLAHEGIEDYSDIDDAWPSMQEYGELTVKLAHRDILTRILEGPSDE